MIQGVAAKAGILFALSFVDDLAVVLLLLYFLFSVTSDKPLFRLYME